MKYLVNSGDVFRDVQVLERINTPQGKLGRRGPYYKCLCLRCGNDNYIATSGDLRSGRITSCGCYRNSQDYANACVVHGHARRNKGTISQAYESWLEMKKRCDNPQAKNFPWYGGKGIKYTVRWKYFREFLEDMGNPEEGMTLDRLDSNKDYCKENCRWLTKSQNSMRHNYAT